LRAISRSFLAPLLRALFAGWLLLAIVVIY
jgi:hypothetical protein